MTANPPRPVRNGFSAAEMVVVSLLTTLLSMLLATVWTGFCRPARDAATRCRLATEANLAAYALAQDLSGNLTGVQSAPDPTPGAEPGQVCLQLISENPDGSSSTVAYRLNGTRLVRDDPTGVEVTLSGELLAFSETGAGLVLAPWSDGAGNQGVEITLTFACSEKNGTYNTVDDSGNVVVNNLTLTYKIVAVQPTVF